MPYPAPKPSLTLARPSAFSQTLRWILLATAAIFFILHFFHLRADFPNNSPWSDWSKYTDEGWYGDAAIRHVLFGHWYWPGDFNPAVALPVWPAIEVIVFRIFGVSAAAARALAVCVFGLTLFVTWLLLERHTRPRTAASPPPLAAAIAVLLLSVNPFLYVFERMAILEPLLVGLTLVALVAASHVHPLSLNKRSWKEIIPSVALGLLLPTIILTKTTGIALFPAIAYMVWARAGYRLRIAIRFAILPGLMASAIWLMYFFLFVHPHYFTDYQYLFSANGYTGIELEPFAKVILKTISDGVWMGHILYPLFFIIFALALFLRPRLFLNPLVPALLLWTAGYFAFLGYHNNLQPRYYLVVAVPITLLVALGLDSFREARGRRSTLVVRALVAAAVLAIAVPDAVQTLDYVLHPEYTFLAAAQAIRKIVLADKTHSDLILSISGSDITLMTGLPSIDDDFGTMDLSVRAKTYRPGWYVAWNHIEDDKMDALAPLFRVERVAAFAAMDDPDRNLLILYRLDPSEVAPLPVHPRKRTPKPLVTKLGQQPETQQLEH